MARDPYRSSELEHSERPSTTLFYAPRTTAAFGPGCVPFVACVAIGGIAGVIFDHRLVAMALGILVGLSIGAVRNRTGDTAGVLLSVRDGVLTIGRGKRGWKKIAEAQLADVVDVTVETETLLASVGPRIGSPGFGMDPVGPRPVPTVDESRIAVLFRRGEPVYLTTDRVSNADAVESHSELRRFLKSHGWQSVEERQRKTKLLKANETGKLSIMGLLVTPTEAASDALRMVRQKFEIDLDYSIDSLRQVDELVDRIAVEARNVEERRAWVLLFGCYTGEVLVQEADAVWALIADDEALQEHFDPELQFVLRVGETIANPLGKAAKRLENGPEDSLFGFAQTSIALAKAHGTSES